MTVHYYLQIGLDSSATLCYDNKTLHLYARRPCLMAGNA
jgi:hypothetical protein